MLAGPGDAVGEVPAEPGTEVGEVPPVLDETGSEARLAGLENSPHAVSTSASRTNGTTLNDFLTQAFVTIPPRLRASAAAGNVCPVVLKS